MVAQEHDEQTLRLLASYTRCHNVTQFLHKVPFALSEVRTIETPKNRISRSLVHQKHLLQSRRDAVEEAVPSGSGFQRR